MANQMNDEIEKIWNTVDEYCNDIASGTMDSMSNLFCSDLIVYNTDRLKKMGIYL
tara:strand:- start:127 stop:291 length:165 start_codon:yes stop_codon:yes gene_type:complete